MTEPSVNDWMFEQINADIAALQKSIREITQKSERGETVGGFEAFAYVDLPRAADGGMSDGSAYIDVAWCTNCRKSGEGVGAGTGVPCYYDAILDDYRRFEDNAQVAT